MSKMVRSPLFLMALTIFIDFTGFGLVIPLLPFWAEHLGAGPAAVGLILTVYALAQFIFTPVLGKLSDHYGRKPVIFSSLLIEAVSLAFTALAGSLPLLLVARFTGGLGASNIGSAQALVADVTPPQGRARGMGVIGAAIGLGFVVGPALGGMLASVGPAIPFWAAMGLAVVNALLVMCFLPETHGKQEVAASASSHNRAPGGLLTGWGKALRYPAVTRLVMINLLLTVAFAAMEAVFPLFTQHTFGWMARENGYIFTYVGFVVVLVQGGLVGRIARRFDEHILLIAGLVMLAAGLALIAWSTNLALLFISLGILSAGDGGATPAVSALLSFVSPAGAQGETLGFAQGVAGLGRIIGPLVAGSLFAMAGPGSPFLVGGILVALAVALALPVLPIRQEAEEVHVGTEDRREPERIRRILSEANKKIS